METRSITSGHWRITLPALLALGCSTEDTTRLELEDSVEPALPAPVVNAPEMPDPGGEVPAPVMDEREAPDPGGDSPDPGENDGAAPPPLYAIMYEVFDDVGSSSYLSLIDDLDDGVVDPATSREYAGGRAFLRTYGGWVFVGDPTAPTVTRYAVSESGELVDERTISFANFGMDAGMIDAWNLTFISPEKAYLFDYVRGGTTIIWDPTRMEILGTIEAPAEFIRPGLSIDCSPGVLRDGKLYRSVFWADYDTATYSTDQLLAIYDTENDTMLELVSETRCPNPGNLAHMDETGNIYFSNWTWPIAGTLMRDAPSNCVLKVPAGSDRYDPSWTLPYTELSGGHEGAMFTYVGAGRGLVAIFDESRISFDATTDPWAYAGSGNWSIWNVDVQARTASPLEGIPLNAGAYTPAVLDDRLFLVVPEEGWGSAGLYEVKDGVAVPGLDIPGWSYAFEKLR